MKVERISYSLDEVFTELERVGTAQNRKVYACHGAPDNQFGVSFADLGRLTKEIKRDQALAEALWKTGVADARILATMIADPKALTRATAEAWLAETTY